MLLPAWAARVVIGLAADLTRDPVDVLEHLAYGLADPAVRVSKVENRVNRPKPLVYRPRPTSVAVSI